MKETMTGLAQKVKTFFASMTKKTRTLLICGVAAVVLGAVIIALILNNQPYSVLFTGLTGDEARSIASYLDENGQTDYRLEGGDTILVPKDEEAQLKAKLLMEGYPKTGFAYETYRSAVGTMSTQSDRNMAYLQDLQDRMAAVIRCMDGVKDAVVTIAQGEDRRYILSTDNVVEATASVLVTMQGGTKLSPQVAEAIRNLVARGVKGLEIDNITVSDSLGNIYTPDSGSAGSMTSSQLKLQLEEQVNNATRTQVMAVLAPLYGPDNVRVGVNSNVDVSRTIGESTKYTEPDWAADGSTGGQGIIGSKIYDQEVVRPGDGGVGGVVGTGTNSEINNYVEGGINADGDSTYIKNSGQVDYNVNTDKTQVERTAGTVTDLMVSVSINGATAGAVSPAEIINHVARAAGIPTEVQGEKISILVAPFYTADEPAIVPPTALLPQWAIYAAGAGLLVLLLVVLLLSRRGKKKKGKKAAQLDSMLSGAVFADGMGEQAATMGADIMNLRTEKSLGLRKDVRQFAEENPEIAAQMVRTWLKGGEEKDG